MPCLVFNKGGNNSAGDPFLRVLNTFYLTGEVVVFCNLQVKPQPFFYCVQVVAAGEKMPFVKVAILAGLAAAGGEIAVTIASRKCVALDGFSIRSMVDTMALHAEGRG